MANTNDIFHTIARKQSVGGVQPPRHTTIQRAAESLSRRTVDMATCELLNEAHSRLIILCYQRHDSGQLCNVDDATGRILIPLPWGKAGYAKWGLTPSEGDWFRRIMFARQLGGVPLFHFERSRRSWYVDIRTYAVIPPLDEWEISLAEYRMARQQK